MSKIRKTMDGNEAAAYASYAFTEVATIYPITPSSQMPELVDKWSANGKKNIFGQPVRLVEMQSEAGAVAAMHGALDGGVLSTSYSASQGLMLMIPTMYRIAGQLKPGVIHVSSRVVATHAISIFAEHSDVMACRQTGFALLASSSVQEAMDLGAVAHLASIKGHVPFLHFFDGFRTSHEVQKVDCLDYDDLAKLVDYEELEKFRKNSLNPEYPVLMTTGQNPDTYFQGREACNTYYDNLPDIVEEYMEEINKLTGKNYKPFNYYGPGDAEYVIIGMGSVTGTAQETIDYLSAKDEKVGYLEVHLYRPFSAKHFLKALPETVKKITVLDRTKEPGAVGEPLYEDVCSVFQEVSNSPNIYACRFGLGSKDTTPAQIVAIYDNMKLDKPKNHFTVGINDDVTHLSIEVGSEINIVPEGTISCKFWGLGSDGTVGANKNTIKIIGDHTDMYVQGYFEYDGKKSGGVTRSHLRFGKSPIRSSYLVKQADFVACHNQSYIEKYDIVSDIKPDGSLLLACNWKEEELDKYLPIGFKKEVAKKNINLYIINSTKIAGELGLGNRTNTVLQAAFFKIAGIIPVEEAAKYMKDAILKSYGAKGDKIVNMNYAAVDKGIESIVRVDVPTKWANLSEEIQEKSDERLPKFIKKILMEVNSMKGDDIPVSEFLDQVDGTVPQGTSQYEKRGIAVNVPEWNKDNCIQCNQCSYVCPHAAIRPFLVTKEEVEKAPEGFETIKANGKSAEEYSYRIQVDVLDCTGCGSCANACPSKEKSLVMKPLGEQMDQAKNWEYAMELSDKENPYGISNVKGSQFEQPLLEFSGACAGCGETPYAKLVTQLYGDRAYIANATGCAQVWATCYPSFPYTKNKEGHGPAVAGSLFENNAEFGFGIMLSVEQQRSRLLMKVEELIPLTKDETIKNLATAWVKSFNELDASKEASDAFKKVLATYKPTKEEKDLIDYIKNNKEHLAKKSIWLFGGDGWAYDIGYGGLDHVIASGANVNIMVFDTETYSNTGGQASKASPTGAVAYFAASGKKTKKKDLGMMAMSYEDVYVAQVAMGANQAQLLKAVREAESYDGPSVIIAYAPCIAHGLKCGMGGVQQEIKRAVEAGYWQLYRYNPMLAKEGKNPFILDSKEPTMDYKEFLRGEVRYSALEREFPKEAERLFEKSEKEAKARYEKYKSLSEQEVKISDNKKIALAES
ncbi:pyruvate:ferredoxin (flavodoxin) oxidoreductase [Wukongibacter sp. M2B1]|uniref:pyruvate:ferredoxin (flavodoxin) oxidoreductase n=1 Tax=Wukongibacter sp. M2B1 TaxID=3088895 RepID=UPI003D7A8A1A